MHIREAIPEDALEVAHLQVIAGRGNQPRGFYDDLIPSETEKTLGSLFLAKEKSYCHMSLTYVALQNKKVLSTISAFDASIYSRASLRRALASIGWNNSQIESAFLRLSIWDRCAVDVPDSSWVIENLATLAEYRRQGFAQALLSHSISMAKGHKYKSVFVSTFSDNIPALKLYKKNGFVVDNQILDEEFAEHYGHSGISRLHLEI